MTRQLDSPDLPALQAHAEAPDGFSLREAAEIVELMEVAVAGLLNRGFETPPELGRLVAGLVGRQGWRHYLAWAGKEVVALDVGAKCRYGRLLCPFLPISHQKRIQSTVSRMY